ncbi:MAG: hypothetical protein K9W44_00705 [Candidatus Lokiarchaeota archaeon]|nr:hypothetical protein [Candidatus Harpocratesius repetitus]
MIYSCSANIYKEFNTTGNEGWFYFSFIWDNSSDFIYDFFVERKQIHTPISSEDFQIDFRSGESTQFTIDDVIHIEWDSQVVSGAHWIEAYLQTENITSIDEIKPSFHKDEPINNSTVVLDGSDAELTYYFRVVFENDMEFFTLLN